MTFHVKMSWFGIILYFFIPLYVLVWVASWKSAEKFSSFLFSNSLADCPGTQICHRTFTGNRSGDNLRPSFQSKWYFRLSIHLFLSITFICSTDNTNPPLHRWVIETQIVKIISLSMFSSNAPSVDERQDTFVAIVFAQIPWKRKAVHSCFLDIIIILGCPQNSKCCNCHFHRTLFEICLFNAIVAQRASSVSSAS